jgi:hypothetical protein
MWWSSGIGANPLRLPYQSPGNGFVGAGVQTIMGNGFIQLSDLRKIKSMRTSLCFCPKKAPLPSGIDYLFGVALILISPLLLGTGANH